jgi:hypothetical protein
MVGVVCTLDGIGRQGSIGAAASISIVGRLQGDESYDQRPGNAVLGVHSNRIGIPTAVGGLCRWLDEAISPILSRNNTEQHR